MIICFECTAAAKEALVQLIQSGGYSDYGEAINSAVRNQLVLHGRVGGKGAVVIDDAQGGDLPGSEPYTAKSSQVRTDEYVSDPKTRQEVNLRPPEPKTIRVPQLFSRDGLPPRPNSFVALPKDHWTEGDGVPVDKWVFGQYNRLLPAKASCRALAHLTQDDAAGLDVEETATMIGKEAWELGEYLARLDIQYGIPRDESLATAFPSSDRDAHKGCLRFANQFVAGVTKNAQLWGLLYELKLINSSDRENHKMKLTEPGWELGTFWNAVLDHPGDGPPEKFTHEEIDFLLAHIRSSVKGEDEAYRLILRLVSHGANSPRELDKELKEFVSSDPNKPIKDSFISTQRSGAVSRMADLGLLVRKRDGVKVQYLVSERGQQYIAEKQGDDNE